MNTTVAHYVMGLLMVMVALAILTTQPFLSLVLGLCGVITLGRILRKLL